MLKQTDKVRRYFDHTSTEYRVIWSGKEMPLHFGYYDETVKTHQQSLLKINDVIAQFASIKKQERVLDAGCGYGASSRWLAKNIGCYVVGITIVPKQLKKARFLTAKSNLSDRVKFHLRDYTNTIFPSGSFDIVWGLESIVHAENKGKFIKEAYRLLRNGGRIVIAEFMQRENLKHDEKEFVKRWIEGWAMSSILSPKEYVRLLSVARFHSIKIKDISENVRKSLARLGIMAKISYPLAKLLHRMGILSRERFKNVETSFLQYIDFQKGLFRYVIICAEK